MESAVLQKQALSNSKEQFAASPDLMRELTNAPMNSIDAQQEGSTRALNSSDVRAAQIHLLLSHFGLYENLKAGAQGA